MRSKAPNFPKNNESGLIGVVVLLLILLGIGIGVYLVQTRTNLNPFAQQASTNQNRPDLSTARSPETFRLQNQKSDLEFYLNPFGETWKSKRHQNPDIPVMITSFFDRTKGASVDRPARQTQFNRFLPEYFSENPWNVYPKPDVDYYLDLKDGYDELIKKASTDLTFIIAGPSGRASNKLYYDMKVQKIVNREVNEVNPKLQFFGYHVINFVEEPDMAGYENMPEDYYLHKKDMPLTPENRLSASPVWRSADGSYHGQFVLDLTKQGLQDKLAEAIKKSMVDNNIKAVLIDGSGFSMPHQFVYSLNPEYPADPEKALKLEGKNVYPPHFFDYTQYNLDNSANSPFAISLRQTLAKIKAQLTPIGKEVYFNPITPDALNDTRVGQVKQLFEVSDGTYWEDPFRKSSRDYFANLNQNADYYFDTLQKFFDLNSQMNKKLIIESNTLIDMMGTINCTSIPGTPHACAYSEAYARALETHGYEAWLKEEQRIARLNLGLFLLFMTDNKNNFYKHHSLMEEYSYETAENFFADWDLRIGNPLGKKVKISDNIYKRKFENGLVVVNYSDRAFLIKHPDLPCNNFHQNICLEPGYVTADGVPVTEYSIEPMTSMIFVTPKILEPFNPSFETVWNWKPNTNQWGELDYEEFRTGKRSLKIPSGIPGSPGLNQKYTFRPNTTYTWSAFVKTENNQNSETVSVMVPGGVSTTHKLNEGRFVYDNLIPLGTNPWRKISMTFTTQNGGVGYLYAALQNGSNGTVWFDDVILQEGNPRVINFTDKSLAYCLEDGKTSRIHLEWEQAPGATSYEVFRSGFDPSSNYDQTGTRATENSRLEKIADLTHYAYNDETVTPGVTYYYDIGSDNGYATSTTPITAQVCGTKEPPEPTPLPPANLPSPLATPFTGDGRDLNSNGIIDRFEGLVRIIFGR